MSINTLDKSIQSTYNPFCGMRDIYNYIRLIGL